MSPTFNNGSLLRHRGELAFNESKGIFPAVMVRIAEQNRIDAVKAEVTERIRAAEMHRKQLLDALDRNQREINILKHERANINLSNLEHVYYATEMISGCPKNGCKGMIRSDLKCVLCSTSVCGRCAKERGEGEEHKCNSEDVASHAFIMRDTRPCPKCATRIHKIDGCNHFFCTGCHTGFDWRTGALINNATNTNPHFYEYMRSHPELAAAMDGRNTVRCGEENETALPSSHALMVRTRESQKYAEIMEIHRRVRHIESFDVNRYRAAMNANPVSVQSTDAVRFLKNEISEEHYKKNLRAKLKAREKAKSTFLIVDTMIKCIGALLHMLIIDLPGSEDKNATISVCIHAIRNVRKDTNRDLQLLAQQYRNTPLLVHNNFSGLVTSDASPAKDIQ